jgi:hypothetical protein
MSHERTLLFVAALGTPPMLVATDAPIRFAVSHTRTDQTRLPADLPPATLGDPPSGRLLVDADPRESLVHSAASFVRAAARALPHSAEDERIVAARVAQVLGDEKPRPLTRKLIG